MRSGRTHQTGDEHPSAIGQRFFYGESCRKNYRKAFPYLLKAARAGDVHPQNLVGYCYDHGLGVRSRLCRKRHPEIIKIGGERSATCRGCAAFLTRHMPEQRNLGRLRYFFGRGDLMRTNMSNEQMTSFGSVSRRSFLALAGRRRSRSRRKSASAFRSASNSIPSATNWPKT